MYVSVRFLFSSFAALCGEGQLNTYVEPVIIVPALAALDIFVLFDGVHFVSKIAVRVLLATISCTSIVGYVTMIARR